jgi:hypothetical protein
MSHGPRDLRLFLRDTLDPCGLPWNRPRSPRPPLPRGQSAVGSRCFGFQFKLLSWGCPKIASPPIQASRVHSQRIRRPSFGTGLPPLVLVPPLSFLPTSAACSARAPQVYCTLQPVMRFAPFPVWISGDPRGSTSDASTFPERALHTLQSFPLVVSRTASPRPLPSRGSTALPTRDTRARLQSSEPSATSGLCSNVESVARCACFHSHPARCSPGLRSPSGSSPPRWVPRHRPSEITKTTRRRTGEPPACRHRLLRRAGDDSPRASRQSTSGPLPRQPAHAPRRVCARAVLPRSSRTVELASVLQQAPVRIDSEAQGLELPRARRDVHRGTAAPRQSSPPNPA